MIKSEMSVVSAMVMDTKQSRVMKEEAGRLMVAEQCKEMKEKADRLKKEKEAKMAKAKLARKQAREKARQQRAKMAQMGLKVPEGHASRRRRMSKATFGKDADKENNKLR